MALVAFSLHSLFIITALVCAGCTGVTLRFRSRLDQRKNDENPNSVASRSEFGKICVFALSKTPNSFSFLDKYSEKVVFPEHGAKRRPIAIEAPFFVAHHTAVDR